MDWREHITVDPHVCRGQACLRGTRIPVSVVLDNLAAGVPIDEILGSYPSLTPEAVQAAVSYAAEVLEDGGLAEAVREGLRTDEVGREQIAVFRGEG